MLVFRRLLFTFSLGLTVFTVDLGASPPSPALAQAGETETEKTIRVGVVGNPPFVVYGEYPQADINGISLEVWREVADSQAWRSDYRPQSSVDEGIKAVAAQKIDILVGPISITPERAAINGITFTQPYFNSGVGLMIPGEPISLWQRLSPFFGLAALSSAGILTLLLFIVGNLIWLVEHRHNPEQFSPQYAEGVQNGMWFALVTLTTVGYGDRSPQTKIGQLIAGVWMLVALLSFSSITAGLASAFTAAVSQSKVSPTIENVEDLENKDIAVITGTTAAEWADFYQADIRFANNLAGAVNLLQQNKVEAVMFDRPALIYFAQQHPQYNLKVTEMRISLEPYGFVVVENSPIKKIVDVQLLSLIYSRKMHLFIERWLGENFTDDLDSLQINTDQN